MSWTLFFLAWNILLHTNLIQLAAQSHECLTNGSHPIDNEYANNLNSLLYSVPNNLGQDGFFQDSVGWRGPETASVAVLCRGDVQLAECRDCLRYIISFLPTSCPNHRRAFGWSDFCTLHYSDENLTQRLDTSARLYQWNTHNIDSPAPDMFMRDLTRLLFDLSARAAGSTRKVAAGNIVTGRDHRDIFAMVHCTPDLSPDNCSACLRLICADVAQFWNRRRGGRVIVPSCNLRYEVNKFYNETRLRELTAPTEFLFCVGTNHGNNSSSSPSEIVVIVLVSVCSVLAAVAATVWLLLRRRMKLKHETHDVDEILEAQSLKYALTTIRAATNNFSDGNKLGQGGFGAVYKGILADGREIAVKRLSSNSTQGDLEFKNEVLLLANLRHRNLVRLVGFCLEGAEKILVYEFVQNGSLDHFIFESVNRSYLDWEERCNIIGGVARGLLYLHEDSQLKIIHRDLKPNNVLLDGLMNPKIADFGMARLFGQGETHGDTSKIVGTIGYMAPEYAIHGQISIKLDVFSFGVLMLEIISGQRKNYFRHGRNVEDLLSFAWKKWHEGTPIQMVDQCLKSASDFTREMERCIQIALLCVQQHAIDRPTMAFVVLMLSSSDLVLAEPSEPAFYMPGGYGSESSSLVQGNNPRRSNHKSSSNSATQNRPDNSSENGMSISELPNEGLKAQPNYREKQKERGTVWTVVGSQLRFGPLLFSHVRAARKRFEGNRPLLVERKTGLLLFDANDRGPRLLDKSLERLLLFSHGLGVLGVFSVRS
ncbi:Cysteine-rich receptor-like protein kinase 25 [Striga hermonthica]|uniref:Cysteine-rich receptor-like protein kinase 25 n=1 Tax=Striga hermonthica TaxID=68872 RepID=A0A9N7P2H1_STRHE|nr:Cysteine-rich receptor-like protein kinase 25 [Striga hermonthica]